MLDVITTSPKYRYKRNDEIMEQFSHVMLSSEQDFSLESHGFDLIMLHIAC